MKLGVRGHTQSITVRCLLKCGLCLVSLHLLFITALEGVYWDFNFTGKKTEFCVD